MNPKIHVISIHEGYQPCILKQLEVIFGDRAELFTVTVKNLQMNMVQDGEIVLLSRSFLLSVVRPFIPNNSPVIIAHREVNIVNAKKLIELPSGQKILVINDEPENTKETVLSLKNTLPMHTYYYDDGTDPVIPDDIDYIVTPGEKDFVPDTYRNVIDIGPRLLSYGTVWKLSQAMGTDLTDEQLVNRYIKSQVTLSLGDAEPNDHHAVTTFGQPQLSYQDLIAINTKIEEHGFLAESLKILELYIEGKRKLQTFGRLRLKEKLEQHAIRLSEQKLRRRLEVLQELGLLMARQGRAGTMITALGEEYYEMVKAGQRSR